MIHLLFYRRVLPRGGGLMYRPELGLYMLSLPRFYPQQLLNGSSIDCNV